MDSNNKWGKDVFECFINWLINNQNLMGFEELVARVQTKDQAQ